MKNSRFKLWRETEYSGEKVKNGKIRKSSLHLWERKVVVVGDKLLLITTPTEIEEKIDWLKKVIESTNIHVEEFNQTQKFMDEEEKAEELRKHENIIRDALKNWLLLSVPKIINCFRLHQKFKEKSSGPVETKFKICIV